MQKNARKGWMPTAFDLIFFTKLYNMIATSEQSTTLYYIQDGWFYRLKIVSKQSHVKWVAAPCSAAFSHNGCALLGWWW